MDSVCIPQHMVTQTSFPNRHRYRRIARFVSHSRVSTALVVFLGFAGFGGLLGFFYELYRYHRGRKSSDSGLHEIKKRHLV